MNVIFAKFCHTIVTPYFRYIFESFVKIFKIKTYIIIL